MTELEFTSNNTFYYIFRYAKNEEISNGLIDSVQYCINKRYESAKLEKTLTLLLRGY